MTLKVKIRDKFKIKGFSKMEEQRLTKIGCQGSQSSIRGM